MDTLRPREFDEIAALEQPSIVASMWRYRWLVALIVTVFIGLGLAFQAYVPAAYQATAEMVVEDPRASQLFNVGEVITGGQSGATRATGHRRPARLTMLVGATRQAGGGHAPSPAQLSPPPSDGWSCRGPRPRLA